MPFKKPFHPTKMSTISIYLESFFEWKNGRCKDITPNFANGVDFEKGKDQITGPAFFTTHNIYNALLYGSKGMLTWGQPVLDLEQHKNPELASAGQLFCFFDLDSQVKL